jgi:hypothetical protein
MTAFIEGIRSWRKVLATTGADERPTVFSNAAREIAQWTTRGLLKADAVDVLVEVGQGIGLDDDELQEVLDEAFGNLEMVPDDPDIWSKPNGGDAAAFASLLYGYREVPMDRRGWLHARHYLRRFVCMTIAPGGFGKSSLVLCNAIEMASGRGLIGPAPSERIRVLYWNGEESDRMEVLRRIAALKIAHSLAEPLEGWLFLGEQITSDEHRLAGIDRNGRLIPNERLISYLTQYIGDHAIGCTILDPMISFHRLPEIDNRAMEGLIKSVVEPIASRTNSCIEFSHHTRKGSSSPYGNAEITVDDSRGAGAAMAAVRSVRVLNRMTKEEAEGAGVADEMRRRYLRVTRDKTNMTPPSKARWIFLADVEIGNVGPNGEAADHVQAVTAWAYPSAFDGVAVESLHHVRDLVAAGNYRKSAQAADWVGIPVAQHLGLKLSNRGERRRLGQILATWFDNGVLSEAERRDPETRKLRKWVVPGPWRDAEER